METHSALRSWFLDTRIYSYFARQRAKRQQFKYDMTRLLVSLKFRPRNWRYHYPFDLINVNERMRVWIVNDGWGLTFRVERSAYGEVTDYSVLIGGRIGWRRKVLRAAREAAKSPWVEKYGLQWEQLNNGERE